MENLYWKIYIPGTLHSPYSSLSGENVIILVLQIGKRRTQAEVASLKPHCW